MRLPSVPSLPRVVWVVGALLLALDTGLVALYLGWKLDWVQHDIFDIGYDRGLSEIAQHCKMLWVGLCGGWLAWRTRQPVYTALSALFLGLLVDDAAMVHERAGVVLGEWLHIPAVAGLNPHDFGEILSVALWVGPLFLIGIVAYHRSDRDARAMAWRALGALVVLAVFGIGADVLHQVLTSAFPDVNGLHSVLTVVEEGGEMVVMTAIAAGALALVLLYRDAPPDLPSGDAQTGGLPVSRMPSAAASA